VDNGNLLNVPGSRIVNLNLHYDTDIQNSFIQKIGAYFEVRNVFNATNLASANNITKHDQQRNRVSESWLFACLRRNERRSQLRDRFDIRRHAADFRRWRQGEVLNGERR